MLLPLRRVHTVSKGGGLMVRTIWRVGPPLLVPFHLFVTGRRHRGERCRSAHRPKFATQVGTALVTVLVASTAWAGAPTDQLKSGIDRVIKILDEPAMKSETKAKERRAAVRKIANDL